MHVIIQAGGKGTRLEALTRNKPKCMVPVNNKPLIFWAFEAFKDHDITVIADYKKEVLSRYLKEFSPIENVNVVSANNEGTISGIKDALSYVDDQEPVLVVWCDLLFSPDFKLPSFLSGKLDKNYVGLSPSFPCRWSFKNGDFVKEPSSSEGVAGFFVFANKSVLEGILEKGPFVPWLKSSQIKFEPFYLENVTEVGTVRAFEKYTRPAICRPFNEVKINEETVTKRGIDEQGRRIAIDEVAWYKHVSNLQFEHIPRIYSLSPLVMERIKGKNIWEYDCLTLSEKSLVIKSIVDSLKLLHSLESDLNVAQADCYETYIAKTFARLKRVKDLVPFANDEYININGVRYKNVFGSIDALVSLVQQFYPSSFCLIHGDPTFSNTIYDRVNSKVYLIDPRGYFGKTKLYGDPDYDWAKVYYSLAGDYDQFNMKKFSLDVQDHGVELAIKPNNWVDMEDYFFSLIPDVNRKKIKLLHALIWLSLTTYTWEDYDSICGAYYNGLIKLSEVI